jgi:hypothetical protein
MIHPPVSVEARKAARNAIRSGSWVRYINFNQSFPVAGSALLFSPPIIGPHRLRAVLYSGGLEIGAARTISIVVGQSVGPFVATEDVFQRIFEQTSPSQNIHPGRATMRLPVNKVISNETSIYRVFMSVDANTFMAVQLELEFELSK